MNAFAFTPSRTQVNSNVHIASISPNIVPDGVIVRVRDGAAFLETHAWHQAVEVVVEAIARTCQKVTLVVNVSIGVQSRNANDRAIQTSGRDSFS
jgi:hypothetical protein